ncbi:MAG: MarR family transcriptional regulator [Clostridiales bacterium]|jgi:DNA-binding MarR family transcriptional regulator|nr:MarR family transcriptional regulator [Clostridiales bacterium]
MKENKVNYFLETVIKLAPDFKQNLGSTLGIIENRTLTNHQFFCVAIIGRSGAISMSELAEALGTSKQQLTRIVNELVAYGLVERCSSPGNHRVVLAKLSPKGIEASESFKEKSVQRAGKLIAAALTEKELDAGIESLKTLYGIFEKLKQYNKKQ